MLTVAQIQEYLRQTIDEQRRAGDTDGLWQMQRAAGLLMEASDNAGDKQTAYTFQLIAADAANKIEEVSGDA